MSDEKNVHSSRMRLLGVIKAGFKVKRFHTEHILMPENVGEHTAGVMAILVAMYYPKFPASELLSAALMHDVGEQWTGDIPAHVKWENPMVAKEVALAEVRAFKEAGLGIPIISDDQKAELKFADSMDCMIKAADEYSLGNSHMLQIMGRLLPLLLQLAGKVHMDRRYFCKEMYTSFQKGITSGNKSE